MNSRQDAPIAVFDSGLGGLSVLRSIRKLLPAEDLIYFGDQAHVPYGRRPMAEVSEFSIKISQFLLDQKAKIIVVACNAASAAALLQLRRIFPEIHFVGMEPAVKPAAESTRTGKVGVLATPATFQGALYASVVERFASDVLLFQDTCPGLVQQIEKGELDTLGTRRILEKALRPMLVEGIDTVVLGCTHYPFVIPLIQEITRGTVNVIDPAPAVALQTKRLLEKDNILRVPASVSEGDLVLYTSGDVKQMKKQLPAFLGEEAAAVKAVRWDGERILKNPNPPAR